ncbi:MAG: hypothetical protein LBP42_00155 [Treponema sp.]|nr:hypothetical protein [Treponema sp.]
MKRTILKLIGMALITAMCLSCGTMERGGSFSTPREAQKEVTADIYKDEPGGTLTIDNRMDMPLVLFAGSIANENMIGGIRANDTRNFEIFDDVPSGSSHGFFLLRAVRESDYTAKGSKLEEDDIRYAALITFDSNSPRPVKRIIQRDLGGEAQILVNNDSDLVLELRINSRDGQAITTLSPWERDKVVYLDPNSRGYTFFPVWQFYDKSSGGIRSIQPEGLEGSYQMRPVMPGGSQPIPRLPFSLSDMNELFTPFATLTVRNETFNGINLQRGSSPLTSQNGYEMINPGAETFELDLSNQRAMVIGGLTIDIGRGRSAYLPVSEYRYEAGYNYVLRLRSDGTLAEIEPLGQMDIMGDLKISLANEN